MLITTNGDFMFNHEIYDLDFGTTQYYKGVILMYAKGMKKFINFNTWNIDFCDVILEI